MKWDRCLLGAAIMALVVGASYWSNAPTFSFNRFGEIKTRLIGQGYYYTSDAQNGTPSIGMLISREPQDPQQLGTLCKVGAMGPTWIGKVWVTRNAEEWQLLCAPDDAEVRVWGNLIAFGDNDMMAELEATLRSASPSE